MAEIVFENPTKNIKEPEKVREFLSKRGVDYRHWLTKPNIEFLLDKSHLNDSEKEELLLGLQNRFEELSKEYGYKSRDLIVLHPDLPGLDDLLAKFDKMHYHSDDEVRYIVDGSGIFGFNLDGEKFEVHVFRNDFISVPAKTHHWFKLDDKKKIKAVRYFKDTSGWTPVYV